MAWFWTDELARALIEAGVVIPEQAQSWVATPVAYRGEGDTLELARRLWAEENPAADSAA